MMPPKGDNVRPPSRKMLAAYVEGELEGNDALLAHKKFIEDWLALHPDAAAEVRALRRLQQVWQDSSPEEPDEETWGRLWTAVDRGLHRAAARKSTRRWPGAWLRGLVAAAVLLGCSTAAWMAWQRFAAPSAWLEGNRDVVTVPPGGGKGGAPDGNNGGVADMGEPDDEAFPVATEDEIVLVHVEDPDTGTFVVGELPVEGPLVLAAPDEVFLNHFEPSPEDDMLPDVHMDNGPPLIWARVEREYFDP